MVFSVLAVFVDFGVFGVELRCTLPCPCLIGSLDALGSGSKPRICSLGNFNPISFSISRKKTVSSGLNKEIASPLAPALPVRPIR